MSSKLLVSVLYLSTHSSILKCYIGYILHNCLLCSAPLHLPRSILVDNYIFHRKNYKLFEPWCGHLSIICNYRTTKSHTHTLSQHSLASSPRSPPRKQTLHVDICTREKSARAWSAKLRDQIRCALIEFAGNTI